MVPQGPSPGNLPLPQSVNVVRGKAGAWAVAGVAEALGDLLEHDVAGWDSLGFERIKERSVRSVLRGQLGEIAVHLKVFRADKLSDRARDVLRGPRGERELHNLLRARSLGLPTVEPLGSGMAKEGDQLRSFVMTRTIALAEPFAFAMSEAVQRTVGSVLRRMHDLGVLPGDLHPGNLLVDASGAPWLLDLTSMRHAGEASLTARAKALAFFCHELDGGAQDQAAKALLASYLASGPALDAAFGRELIFATRRWRADALPAFGRRSTRSCRHTEVPERRRGEPRWYWQLGTGGEDPVVREACIRFAEHPPEPQKSGRRGGVWFDADLVMKRREAGAAKKLWRASYWLTFAKVATAAPVALCTFRSEGSVLYRRILNESLANELTAGRLDAAAVAAAAHSLGTNVGRLHAHGLRNRDLKFDNLVRDPATGAVCMVDLDGILRKSATDVRGAGADLGRLLAAFRGAGSPGGASTLRTFLRAWLRAHRQLQMESSLRRLLRRAEQRAGEWAEAHRAQATHRA
jgi:tRNA A-37 threonylcarbamoyl transferase component Bud32